VFPSAIFTDGNNSIRNAVGVIQFSGSEYFEIIKFKRNFKKLIIIFV